jgi:hypothetical protein
VSDSALDVMLREYDRLVVAYAYGLEASVTAPRDVRVLAMKELADLRARASSAPPGPTEEGGTR